MLSNVGSDIDKQTNTPYLYLQGLTCVPLKIDPILSATDYGTDACAKYTKHAKNI